MSESDLRAPLLPGEAAQPKSVPPESAAATARPEMVEQWTLSLSRGPASTSPVELVVAEGRLVQMLKRHYGWLEPESGVLLRSRTRA